MARNNKGKKRTGSKDGGNSTGGKFRTKPNREYKDALFHIEFSEYPENALSLYNALNNTNYTDVNDLEIIILEDAVFIGVRNDLGFIIYSDLNAYEEQSSFCPNAPLRGLWYIADMYKVYVGKVDIVRRIKRGSIRQIIYDELMA